MMNEVRRKRRFGTWLSCLIPSVLVVACLVFELFLSHPAYAAVFNVASGDVAGLINAINTANGNGQDNTINLAAGTYTLTVVNNDFLGSNGLPSITGKITIKGIDADNTIIERGADASPFRIFFVTEIGTLTLDGLTIRGGFITGNSGGGALHNNGGTVVISNSIVADNGADISGGGIANSGPMTIISSTVVDNTCFLGGSVGGGIVNDEATLIIIGSTIANNGPGFGAGLFSDSGTVTIIKSSITANLGSGIVNESIFSKGTMSIIDSTLANNGVDLFNSPTHAPSTVTITNTTIAGNPLSEIINEVGATLTLQNTILALNSPSFPPNSPNCFGTITSLGNNIIGNNVTFGSTGCTITLQSTDLTGDPGLGTFTDNGTPGNGHFPLLPNSQAINAGNNNVCLSNPILHTDQIGDPRVGICDIGSIEFEEPFKNLGDCISTLIQQNCSGLQGQSRAACNKEQQTFCSDLFKSK